MLNTKEILANTKALKVESAKFNMDNIFKKMDNDEDFYKEIKNLTKSKGISSPLYSNKGSDKGIRFTKDFNFKYPTITISIDKDGNLLTETSSGKNFKIEDYVKELKIFEKDTLTILNQLSK